MLRCSKSARSCGKKHISKSKVLKTDDLGPLLEFKMPEKVHAIVARSTFRSQKREKTNGLGRLLEVEMSKQSARRCGAKHISKSIVSKTDALGRFSKCGCGSAWQARWILHLDKSESNVCVPRHFQKRWHALGICRGSATMHFAWQAQYKRYLHQRC